MSGACCLTWPIWHHIQLHTMHSHWCSGATLIPALPFMPPHLLPCIELSLQGCSGRAIHVLWYLQMRLREMGVLQPTQVQQEAIPTALTGVNLAIQCYTGSGKVGVLTTQCVPTVNIRLITGV